MKKTTKQARLKKNPKNPCKIGSNLYGRNEKTASRENSCI
jgi:hypothetical protein